jgi:spermidine synthase
MMRVMSHRQGRHDGLVVQSQVDCGLAELIRDPDRPSSWTLRVDGTPQSQVDLDDPAQLEFEYMRRLGHLADLMAPPGEPLRILHLGGGALTLARYLSATRPGSWQVAVEVDAALVEFVRANLPLDRAQGRAKVRVRIGDARAVLEQLPPGTFDLVVADLFAGATTGAHLTSAEFTVAAARVLTPAGVFAVNIGDGPPLSHAKSRITTVKGVFSHACLIADAAVLKGRRFGNLVLAAAHQPLPVGPLARRVAADPFPGQLICDAALDRFAAGARTLTDAEAEDSPAPPPGTFALRPRR